MARRRGITPSFPNPNDVFMKPTGGITTGPSLEDIGVLPPDRMPVGRLQVAHRPSRNLNGDPVRSTQTDGDFEFYTLPDGLGGAIYFSGKAHRATLVYWDEYAPRARETERDQEARLKRSFEEWLIAVRRTLDSKDAPKFIYTLAGSHWVNTSASTASLRLTNKWSDILKASKLSSLRAEVFSGNRLDEVGINSTEAYPRVTSAVHDVAVASGEVAGEAAGAAIKAALSSPEAIMLLGVVAVVGLAVLVHEVK